MEIKFLLFISQIHGANLKPISSDFFVTERQLEEIKSIEE